MSEPKMDRVRNEIELEANDKNMEKIKREKNATRAPAAID